MNDKRALLPSIESAFGQVNDILQERDELQREVARLATELTAATARNQTLEGVLARTTADKDRWMTYARELRVQLKHAAETILAAVDVAQANVGSAPPPEDERALRKIAQRFAPTRETP